MEHYAYQFKYFDPINGRLPDPFEIEYVELLYRARKLLTGFTSDQLKLAIEELNEFVRHKNFINPFINLNARITIQVIDHGQVLNIIPSDNTIQAFYSNIKTVSLSEFDLLSAFSWSEVFAMITIFYAELIAGSIHNIEHYKENQFFQKPTIETALKKAKDRLPEAYQALAYAEVLNDQEYLFDVLKTEKARSALKKKHLEKYDPFRKLIESIYLEHYLRFSARAAAKKILKKLIDENKVSFDELTNRLTFEGKITLQTDDPAKQLEKWIGKIKKTQIKIQDE